MINNHIPDLTLIKTAKEGRDKEVRELSNKIFQQYSVLTNLVVTQLLMVKLNLDMFPPEQAVEKVKHEIAQFMQMYEHRVLELAKDAEKLQQFKD